MKSATPRTDAAIRRVCGPSVSIDFARTLESELNVANAELEAFRKSIPVSPSAAELIDLRRERDALKIEYESRVIWIDKMLDILGCKNPDGFNCKDPHLEAQIIVKERDLLERELTKLLAELKK